jgi:hypothetical protein
VIVLCKEGTPGGTPRGEEPGTAPEGGPTLRTEEVVRCASCGHVLAHERHGIAPGGRHAHTFVNPSGMEFTIRCFREADGCAGWGETSSFWSWFPGHAWRVALCGACSAHVGWSFTPPSGDARVFFGLIVDRLA